MGSAPCRGVEEIASGIEQWCRPSFQWVTSGMRAIGGNGGDHGIPSAARYMSDGTRVGQWGCDGRAQTETTPTVVVPALALSF